MHDIRACIQTSEICVWPWLLAFVLVCWTCEIPHRLIRYPAIILYVQDCCLMSKGSCVVTWRWMSVPNFKPWYSCIHLMAISLSQVELSACQNQLEQETAARARAEAQVLEVLSGFSHNLLKLNKQLLSWSHCACGMNIPGEVYVHTFLLAEVALCTYSKLFDDHSIFFSCMQQLSLLIFYGCK